LRQFENRMLRGVLQPNRDELVPATGYPDGGFSWFSSVPPGECWDRILKLGHKHFLPNPLKFMVSQHSIIDAI
jgi:hypothetical protein